MTLQTPVETCGSIQAVPWHQVQICDEGFWGARLRTNREVTLAIEYEQCRKTGRLDAFRLTWQPGERNQPHPYWDSDVAKWVEAAAYSLATHPDADLQAKLDTVVELIVSAQQPDGYLNTYFTRVCPEQRWTNLRDMHEIYCAGHLVEAAVAVYQATGQRKLLDCLCRYIDLIDAIFGPEAEGKRPGYCGHQEIELALIKLYRVTGEERYLKLCDFFIAQRGQSPNYYQLEAEALGLHFNPQVLVHYQAHLPILQQQDAEGHAVRAMYQCSGMVDLAAETGDARLMEHGRRMWRSVVDRRMYITGGIGSTGQGECFTFDYDLPNETAYAETCAAVGLVFFAHRMLHQEPRAEYADVMELALYNGILSGVNLAGDRFFYANPLRSSPALREAKHSQHVFAERQPWFDTSCCPPNLARLLASLGGYVYGTTDQTLLIHQYIASDVRVTLVDQPVQVQMRTRYPWDEQVTLQVQVERPTAWTLALRIPGWCPGARLRINRAADVAVMPDASGYCRIDRVWCDGDRVELVLPMPVQRQYTHPACRMNLGKVALRRGPIIYCVEEVDLGFDPGRLVIPAAAALTSHFDPQRLGGAVVITGQGLQHDEASWPGSLYSAQTPRLEPVAFQAVPYALWGNRSAGGMAVWLQERSCL